MEVASFNATEETPLWLLKMELYPEPDIHESE
jgi:hypothetical protein